MKEEIIEFDANSNIGKLEAVPQPYKFTYKITLWSKLQSQMNYMSRMLNSMLGHFHNLEVFDVSGNPTTVFMELKTPILKGDMLLESERTFQHVYTYEIWTNIDERIQKDVYITKDTHNNLYNKMFAGLTKTNSENFTDVYFIELPDDLPQNNSDIYGMFNYKYNINLHNTKSYKDTDVLGWLQLDVNS